ncbi:3-hydroxyacyl-CoA dehydrogenase NAD-binding domain-containing protein [Pseudogemmobacter sonorensis]|uniref:3-hydroxyacyl-CoA dehydrogenase NAD-binding domain-containing protein n=1 Tax=Pseudogemmobacter sonorensis TaxID=2989681 RepID=UPI0036C52B1B
MTKAGLDKGAVVAVIGAGTMGAGIAQVAAAAGHPVLLHDAKEGAAEAGLARLASGLEGQVRRGRLAQDAAEALFARISVAPELEDLGPAALAVEAVVERLEVKQQIFSRLEGILTQTAVLASNTSSISVTAIGAGLARPGNLVGMHFFNPAPVMKLVEVVSGLATDPDVAALVHATATDWGKVAVHANSTPGFIVNRVARAYYGEPLRLLEEGMADPATLDALLTRGGGFRMGPFALMDLIGNDVNLAVSRSVFEAYHGEPRFRPSILQQEMVAAGWLGRKSGRGFYDYSEGAPSPQPAETAPDATAGLWPAVVPGEEARQGGVLVAPTDGRTAAARAAEEGCPVILTDLLAASGEGQRLGYAASPDLPAAAEARLVATLAAQGIKATRLPDWPGLVVLRVLALIANEGFEAVQQGVAAEADIDAAMVNGVNYPQGPIGWARQIGLDRVLAVLTRLQEATGDMRYRPSVALRRAAG